MRGDLLAVLDDLVGRLHDGGAAHGRRARTAGAAAGDQLVAVALQQPDAVERDAELVGQNLRKGRRVALAVIERAGDDGHRAVVLEADAALFGGHRRGGLDIAGDAEAAQLAGALAVALARLEALDVGALHRILEQAGEVAAVVVDAGRRLERHFLGLDEIAPAQLEPVDAEFGRGEVHRALHAERAFGASGAAIGGDQRGVGEHALGRHFEQRRAVHADDVLGDVDGRQQRAEGRAVAAEIAVAGEAHRLDQAVFVEGDFDGHVVVAAVMVGHETAGALVGPFHRPARACAPHAGCRHIPDRPRPSCRTSRRHCR